MAPDGATALVDDRLDELLAWWGDGRTGDAVAFRSRQFDLGLAWVNFEPGAGGLGVPAGHQVEVEARLQAAGAPPRNRDYVGMHQAAAALHDAGSPSQRSRFLRPLFTGEERWCQLYSEPGAGSDLAGLATQATRDGDEWVVRGQKVWTSGAVGAHWAILLARTNVDAPKHRGLTFFVVDMATAGIEIRPIRQADGRAHFNEVFLTDAKVPDEHRIGDVGNGWAVSLTSLHSERDGIGDAFSRPFTSLLDAWRARPDRSSAHAAALRHRVVAMWVQHRVAELNERRRRAAQDVGGASPLGSLAKVQLAELNQAMASLHVELLGPAGQVGLNYGGDSTDAGDGAVGDSPQRAVIRALANSIEGGTSEIQRNIIGERVLGLPGDVRVDKGLPWRDVPRS